MWSRKGKTHQLDFIQIEKFCSMKRMQRQATDWGERDEGLDSRIHRSSQNLRVKNPNNPIKRWATGMNGHFTEEGVQIQRNAWKTVIASHGEMQIKTTTGATPVCQNGYHEHWWWHPVLVVEKLMWHTDGNMTGTAALANTSAVY